VGNPISNRELVDRIVGELSKDFGNKLKEVSQNKGFGWNGSFDFSDLTDKIISAIESGKEKDVGLIIDNAVATKLRNWIDGINPTMKKFYSNKLKEIAGQMVNHAMKNDKIYADMITENVNENREGQSKEQLFRQELLSFKGENEGQPGTVSMEEALQKNAQQLYERTGKVPNGYVLGEDGQVFKEKREDDQPHVEQRTDIEMEK